MYESMVTAHFNLKISRFRCDNGREYLSNEMKQHFIARGIRFEFTIRYTPQQNGVAERMNRTLIERARCMLLNCKVEKRFWSEAVLTAAYVINRSPTSALSDKVPAEVWYGHKLNLKKLKVFGCVAFLKIPSELVSSKFESRTLRCYMMGYCANGYRLWCPEQSKLVLGRDVVFDEQRFQLGEFCDESLSTRNPSSVVRVWMRALRL